MYLCYLLRYKDNTLKLACQDRISSQLSITLRTSLIGTPMSTHRNMQLGRQNNEIPLVPYQTTNFLDQEERLSEITALVSARLAVDPSRGASKFRDNTLASAWYRMHPEDLDDGTRSSDEVGGPYRFLFVVRILNRHRVWMNHSSCGDPEAVHE